MKVEHEPVTGREDKNTLTAPMRALSEFYTALNNKDLALMRENWAHLDESAMDNPVGGIKRGWEEIEAVYAKIFARPDPFNFEFYDYSVHESGDIFYVVGRERGTITANGQLLKLAIRTSRIFRRLDGCWRQVHHHGSIDDPSLLRRYRDLVLTVAAAR